MIYILVVTTLVFVFLGAIYLTKINKKEITFDNDLSPKAEKLPDNLEMTREMLKITGNTHTKVEYNQDEKSEVSFYNHSKDIIIIKNSKEKGDYSRIINTAHECVHATQKPILLKANKWLSNIQILYFLFIAIYMFYNKNETLALVLISIEILILLATFFAKVVIESDASYRAINLANKYLEGKFDNEGIKIFNKKIEENIVKSVPMYYFTLLMQGGIMLILAEIIAII